MCCGHCRPLFFPNLPLPHSTHYVFPSALTHEKEHSPQMLDTTETQSTQYSGRSRFVDEWFVVYSLSSLS